MNKRIIVLIILATIILARTSYAQTQILPDPCYSLYNGELPSTFGSLSNASTYKGLIGYSMLIILAVLMIVAFLYAIGMAFKINRLISFSKNEILENVLNFILILFVAGGIAGVDGVVIGIAQFSASAVGTNQPSITSTSSLYQSACEYYYSDAIGEIGNLIPLALTIFEFNIVSSFKIEYMPNGFGASFRPFAWLGLVSKMASSFSLPIVAITGIELINVYLLAIIYYIFPLFLYLGILFRAFPWTRPIGGALLGLFISFYVFYPALIYAISSITASSSMQALAQSIITNHAITLQTNFFTSSLTTSINPGLTISTIFSSLIIGYTGIITMGGINTIGILISLVICFDLIEAFGDLLGAPSLTHGGVLKKVI